MSLLHVDRDGVPLYPNDKVEYVGPNKLLGTRMVWLNQIYEYNPNGPLVGECEDEFGWIWIVLVKDLRKVPDDSPAAGG